HAVHGGKRIRLIPEVDEHKVGHGAPLAAALLEVGAQAALLADGGAVDGLDGVDVGDLDAEAAGVLEVVDEAEVVLLEGVGGGVAEARGAVDGAVEAAEGQDLEVGLEDEVELGQHGGGVGREVDLG